jgi:xanthine dehydrogenase accessory factor
VTKDRFPRAELLLNCPEDDRKIREVVNKDTYIVIMTHEHKNDKTAVRNVVDSECKYLGMIGSRRKSRQILDELEAEGISRDRLNNIFTPIGLDIKAETPAEIAVSILAELIHVRSTGKPSPISLVRHGKEFHD